MSPKHLIFLGPPGTGKGTQAQYLKDRYGWTPVSSGDVLRAEIKAQSPVGETAAQYVRSGRLVPDGIITGVILAGLERLPRKGGWILDGFPRTVPQAESLSSGLAAWRIRIDSVINFALPDDVIIARIVTRRVCSKCAATYNLRSQPPRQADVCDRCGGAVIQREDDREDVIVTRLATYRRQTAPLIEYYERLGLLNSIDADRPAAAVSEDMERVLAMVDKAG